MSPSHAFGKDHSDDKEDKEEKEAVAENRELNSPVKFSLLDEVKTLKVLCTCVKTKVRGSACCVCDGRYECAVQVETKTVISFG